MSDTGGDELPDPVDELSHPKLLDGFRLVDTETALIVEENKRDVRYQLLVAASPVDGELQQVDIELTKEGDIYYLARASLTADNFSHFKERQHLKKSAVFPDFLANTLKDTFSKVVSNRTTFRAVFTNGTKLTFRQQLDFKNVKIFELDFEVIDREDAYVRSQAQFRYNELKRLIRERKRQLQELVAHVTHTNPQFGAQLKKSSKFLK
jgi:hypothetical protein